MNLYKGSFTNDVRREGEGGGWPISDDSKGGCVYLVLTRGREGVQNPGNLADVICERPLTLFSRPMTQMSFDHVGSYSD